MNEIIKYEPIRSTEIGTQFVTVVELQAMKDAGRTVHDIRSAASKTIKTLEGSIIDIGDIISRGQNQKHSNEDWNNQINGLKDEYLAIQAFLQSLDPNHQAKNI